MTVLEQIKQLSRTLTEKQREDLAKYLRKPTGMPRQKTPAKLRGSWKIAFPDNFDLNSALREIRDEWKEELDLKR